MNGRILKRWWRLFDHLYHDLPDIARHEGIATASLVLGYRLARLIKHRIFRSAVVTRHKSDQQTAAISVGRANDAVLKDGVLFIGYVEAGLGLGVSLRRLIDSIAETNVPFAIFPFNINVESRLVGPFRPARYDLSNGYKINIIETATDQLPLVFDSLGPNRIAKSYNILRTYWELPQAPEPWRSLLEHVDELWAPNEFVAAAFRPVFTRPITIVPPCVEAPASVSPNRSLFGLDSGTFYFLFSFDYFSYPARKNPLGVLRAFHAAFPEGNEKVGLVIKSTGAESQFSEIRTMIANAARRDPRIIVIERHMSETDIHSLIASCDCYISLHRSEGFGFGMAEAMLCGKPVIGTDFSGSTDFLSSSTGYPVSYHLRRLRRGEYVYHEGQVWAEPDISSATRAMRDVVSDPETAQRKALAGLAFASKRYSRDSIGGIAASRIDALLRERIGIDDAVQRSPTSSRTSRSSAGGDC